MWYVEIGSFKQDGAVKTYTIECEEISHSKESGTIIGLVSEDGACEAVLARLKLAGTQNVEGLWEIPGAFYAQFPWED